MKHISNHPVQVASGLFSFAVHFEEMSDKTTHDLKSIEVVTDLNDHVVKAFREHEMFDDVELTRDGFLMIRLTPEGYDALTSFGTRRQKQALRCDCCVGWCGS